MEAFVDLGSDWRTILIDFYCIEVKITESAKKIERRRESEYFSRNIRQRWVLNVMFCHAKNMWLISINPFMSCAVT